MAEQIRNEAVWMQTKLEPVSAQVTARKWRWFEHAEKAESRHSKTDFDMEPSGEIKTGRTKAYMEKRETMKVLKVE